jgi:hypothetical protein
MFAPGNPGNNLFSNDVGIPPTSPADYVQGQRRSPGKPRILLIINMSHKPHVENAGNFGTDHGRD